MIKKLLIVTLFLIIFEVILVIVGWDFFYPLNCIFSMIKYGLIEAAIGLYFYRKMKEENRAVTSLYYILAFYVVLLIIPYLFVGPNIAIFIILSPFVLFLYLIIFAIIMNRMYKQLKDSSIRHKELLIFVSYLVCTIMGLKLAIIGSADSKDKVTYHSDNYEVWYEFFGL